MKRFFIALSALVFGLAGNTAYAGGAAVARIGGGMSLEVIEEAVSCNGGPVAIVLDKDGRKKDQTCNVQITADGVRTTFAGFGKPVFWHKQQFTEISLPAAQ